MKKNKNIKDFLREEDGKAIKKGILISSLGLILGFSGASTDAANVHSSATNGNAHSSTHSNHSSHSSY